MAKPNKLEPGDRVAYAAKFLRNIGAFTGSTPQRRGTFLSYWNADPSFARVRWDDIADPAYQRQLADQNGDDYLADALVKGQVVRAEAIAKVGSPRFADNSI